MTFASTPTLLPLDNFARILGLDDWYFSQVGIFPTRRDNVQCKQVMFQSVGAQDFIAREEIAQRIADAESMIADQLGFWPAPKYVVDERPEYQRPHQRELWGMAGTQRGEWKSIETKWKRFISGGVFNRTSIQSGAAVVLSDPDNDGVDELFTVTVATTVTVTSEIALYFKAADRLNAPLDEIWRIRPIHVEFNGGNAVITGHASQMIAPVKQLGLYPQQLDVSDAANYVTTIDVYRAFTDTTATDSTPYQGVAIWNVLPPQSWSGQISILPVTLAENFNAESQVFATFGQSCNWPFGREPDRFQVNYVSGYPADSQGNMANDMAQAVTYLAVSLLATEKCGCERVNRIIDNLRKPLSEDDAQRFYTQREIERNPFSAIPNRGSLAAWRRVSKLMNYQTVGL